MRRVGMWIMMGMLLLAGIFAFFPAAEPQSAVASAQDPEIMAPSPLSHRVIAIDAGHGLPDGGCVGVKGTKEYTLNLQIAQRVKALLQGAGAEVVMTREDDYALHPRDMPRGKRKATDFAKRKAIVQESEAELVISIHMNEYPSSRASGAQVFYQMEDEESHELASVLQGSLIKAYEKARAYAAKGDFFMLRLGVPGVLVECGFLSNPQEEVLLKTEAHQQILANAIVEGLAEWCAAHPPVLGPPSPSETQEP